MVCFFFFGFLFPSIVISMIGKKNKKTNKENNFLSPLLRLARLQPSSRTRPPSQTYVASDMGYSRSGLFGGQISLFGVFDAQHVCAEFIHGFLIFVGGIGVEDDTSSFQFFFPHKGDV